MRTFFEEVCQPELIRWYRKSERVVALKSGPALRPGGCACQSRLGCRACTAYVFFFGLTNDRGHSFNIRSLNLGACGVDEAIELTENEWLEIQGRLRERHCALHQVFGATNPGSRGHWLYQRMWINADPQVQHVVQTSTLDNPHLPPSYVALISRYKGRYYERYVQGKWVGFDGLVYDVYDPLVHELTWEQFAARKGWGNGYQTTPGVYAIPPKWTRLGGCDFGFTNPFVFQWWAESPDAEYFMYREIYHTRRLVEDHARDIVRLSRGEPARLNSWADHDAEDAATLRRYGVNTMPANKDVANGIQTVYNLLRPDDATGRPRAYFLRDALVEEDPALAGDQERRHPVRTTEEYQVYKYLPGTETRSAKEEPAKVDDHGCDTTRYVLHSHLVGGANAGLLRYMEAEAKKRLAERARAQRGY